LSGPAGTGKTTVAHTIAKEFDKRRQVAATFFLWRKTGDRDDINKLVATLAYQIAEKIPSAKERMEENLKLKGGSGIPSPAPSDLLSRLSLEDQLSKLLTSGPVTVVNSSVSNLVIIDGLDECASQDKICRLIDWIRKNKSPFRFLLTSRPEPEIEDRFTSGLGDGPGGVRALSLTDSADDIRKYFVEQLPHVWPEQRRVKDGGPIKWPSESSLNSLVEKSEGLFVYAATAVRYIAGEGSPENRLRDVLKLHKGLDYLYIQIIEEAVKWDNFDTVMGGLMYLRYQLAVDDLSSILLALDEGLTGSGIRCALRRCHSVLVIAGDNTPIDPHHASLRDFLTDQSRSRALFHAPATCHGRLMFGCLSAITRAFSNGNRAPEYALVSWYYHACSLSAGGTSEGLGELRDETRKLVKEINLNWVRSWLIEAAFWAGVPYLRGNLSPTKV
jgi:hypothetical protein